VATCSVQSAAIKLIEDFSISQTSVAANTHTDIDINVSKSGYTPKALCGWQINGVTNVVIIYAALISNTTARLRVKNISTDQQTISGGHITVIYS
jgi:hypothetical protein